jgi:nucleoid-associated protein YgaU
MALFGDYKTGSAVAEPQQLPALKQKYQSVLILEANRDQLTDPDDIRPGQRPRICG